MIPNLASFIEKYADSPRGSHLKSLLNFVIFLKKNGDLSKKEWWVKIRKFEVAYFRQ